MALNYYRYALEDTEVDFELKAYTVPSNTAVDFELQEITKLMNIKVSGVWKTATPYIRISGVWKQATPYIKISGVWK